MFLVLFLALQSGALAAMEMPVPVTKTTAEIDWKASPSGSTLVQDSALFLINALSDQDVEVKADQLLLSKNDFPSDFWQVLLGSKSPADIFSAFKSPSLKQSLGKLYWEKSRARFHRKIQIPATLKELQALYHFDDKTSGWKKVVVEKSEVKGRKRLLYRSPLKVGDISIAQTALDAKPGDPFLARETEVIARREDADDWDFYVYDEKGALCTSSTFSTKKGKDLVAPVPITCLNCHYDSLERTFTNQAFVRP